MGSHWKVAASQLDDRSWCCVRASTAALRNSDCQRTACPGIALSLSLRAPQVCTELDSRTAGILYSRYMIHSCAKRQPVHSLHHLCKQCANNSHQMCSDTSANQGLVPSPCATTGGSSRSHPRIMDMKSCTSSPNPRYSRWP